MTEGHQSQDANILSVKGETVNSAPHPFLKLPVSKDDVLDVLRGSALYGLGKHLSQESTMIIRAELDKVLMDEALGRHPEDITSEEEKKKERREDKEEEVKEKDVVEETEEKTKEGNGMDGFPGFPDDPFDFKNSDAGRRGVDSKHIVEGKDRSDDHPHTDVDRWGRDKAIHLDGANGGNTVMFIHRDSDAWSRVLSDQQDKTDTYSATPGHDVIDDTNRHNLTEGVDKPSFEPAKNINKKKDIEDLLYSAYLKNVLRKDGLSSLLAHAFFSRARSVLQRYCELMGWVYGRDALVTCQGRVLGEATSPRSAVLNAITKQTFGKETDPDANEGEGLEHQYEIKIRYVNRQTMNDIKRLMLYVTYAVEEWMRSICPCPSEHDPGDEGVHMPIDGKPNETDTSPNGKTPWHFPPSVIEDSSLIAELRRVDPDIARITYPRGRHSDVGVFSVPISLDQNAPATGMSLQGIVVKNCPALVYPPLSCNERLRPFLNVVSYRRDSGIKLPFYVSFSDDHPAYAYGRSISPELTSDASESIRILHHVVVECNEGKTHVDTKKEEGPSQNSRALYKNRLHCSVPILSVNILSPLNWRRSFELDCAWRQPAKMLKTVSLRRASDIESIDRRGAAECSATDIICPNTPLAWQASMQGLFEWMNRVAYNKCIVNEAALRQKIMRLLWWSVLFALTQERPHRKATQGGRRRPGGADAGNNRQHRKRNWTVIPELSNTHTHRSYPSASSTSHERADVATASGFDSNNIDAVIGALCMLDTGISAPEGVPVAGMYEMLIYPFNEIWKATNLLLSNSMRGRTECQRKWFKDIMSKCTSIVSQSLTAATLSATGSHTLDIE